MDRSLAARLPLLRAPRLRMVRLPHVRPLALMILVLALAAAGGGWMWFRSSSFVSVERVQIIGVSGQQAAAIEGALRSQALRMSTLNASLGALRGAVADFPLVRSVSMKTSFPHSMTITVAERWPVAVLSAAGARTAVAADGVVLGESVASSSLPLISGPALLPRVGTRLGGATVAADLTVLGAAPRALGRLVAKVYEGPEGLTAKMRDGLLVYFGDDTRARAKWLSLAAVLANESSAGSAYIDVRLPERPAAGTETTLSKPSPQSPSSEESSLAESLDQAVTGGTAVEPSTAAGASTEIAPASTTEPAETPAVTGSTSEVPGGEVSPTEAPVTEAYGG